MSVRSAIHVAKDSFSHTSSHHASVTRSPNHWCAISWALIEACDALELDRLLLGRREQDALRPGDQARVLHRAEGHRLRDRELVELLVGNGIPKYVLEPLEQRRRSSARRSAPCEALPRGVTMRIGVFFVPAVPAST